jgi:hypothetical protein
LSSPQENIKIQGVSVFSLLDYEIQQSISDLGIKACLDTILVVGGAMQYAGNPSSAIYSF